MNAREAAAAGELDEAIVVLREEQRQYDGIVDGNRKSACDIKERERVGVARSPICALF